MYYLNHNTKTTTWEDPRLSMPKQPSSTPSTHAHRAGTANLGSAASAKPTDPREATIMETERRAAEFRARAVAIATLAPDAQRTEAVVISELIGKEEIKLDALSVGDSPALRARRKAAILELERIGGMLPDANAPFKPSV